MKKFMFCEICSKTTQSGYNRPKSLHKTKRLIQPNVQKWNGLLLCTRCRRSLKKQLPTVAAA
ncbi:MAG: L28 family ribosomal protein [Patescibacteria group bacterium]